MFAALHMLLIGKFNRCNLHNSGTVMLLEFSAENHLASDSLVVDEFPSGIDESCSLAEQSETNLVI